MAEFISHLMKHHPLIAFTILVVLIAPLLPIVLLLLPFLISFLLCFWGVARLMRARERSRSRRRRRSRYGSRHAERRSEEEGWLQWAREGFESERQMRLNEYLEDQLKYLFALRNGTLQEDLMGACDCDPVDDQALANGEYEGKTNNDLLLQDRIRMEDTSMDASY